ncbi:subclass B3 metallo-beta-lactamase [Altererythrobacter salegens]|uniref:Subclass B3 metallo-beta-lactamase n=1 Tax=Croceibacterium salegens TaxID=1737568 RepID=A0A6I4SV44_9SPHN|nr:subclass B3 metallo-beta-lactamase [Croceibacterium salegens]
MLLAFLLVPLLAAAAPEPSATEHGLANCKEWDEWDKPTPPFRIFGDTYYVGTCGISVIVVDTPEGSIVIDGGPRGSGDLIAQNIKSLGFDLKRVTLHLISHEHHDHVGGMAGLQRKTGADVGASAEAAIALEAGTARPGDPQYELHEHFEPVSVQSTIFRPRYSTKSFKIGGLTLVPIATPGHTPGGVSYQWQTCEADACNSSIVYADSLTPVSADDYRFSDHPEYLAAFRKSIETIADLDCDILLTPHPSASNMIERIAGRAPLSDPNSCRAYADAVRVRLDDRLAEEAKGG